MQRVCGPDGNVCQPNRSVGGAPASERVCLTLSGEKPQSDNLGDPRSFAAGEFLERSAKGPPVLTALMCAHVQPQNAVGGLDPTSWPAPARRSSRRSLMAKSHWGNSC